MYKILSVFLLMFVLSSCGKEHVSVFYEFVTTEDLASVQIDTPDPRRDLDEEKERLFVTWSLPYGSSKRSWNIILKVRYHDYTQEEFNIPVDQKRGSYVFELSPEEYKQKKGLLAFKAELFVDGELYDQWTHILWADLIEVKDDEPASF